MPNFNSGTKVWILTMSIALSFLILGYEFAGRLGLFLGLLFAVGFHLLVFFYGDSKLLQFLNAHQLKGQDADGITELVKKYCQQINLDMPEIYLVKTSTATAFASGSSLKGACIGLSENLLKFLSREELEAVIAHQVSHLHRLQGFGFNAAHTLAFSVVGLGNLLDSLVLPKVVFKLPQFRIFSILLSPFAWLILKVAVTDRVYFESDDMAVSLVRDRKPLAEALWKLENLSQVDPLLELPPCSSHFFIVNPRGLKEKNWFLLTHPKIDIRVKRLIGYFPI